LKRSHLLAHCLAAIDRTSRVPLHAQIAAAIRGAIRDGSVAAGSRLPSTRSLAWEAGVSRNTAMAAYEALARQSLIVSAVGSGTRVSGALPVVQVSESAWQRAIRESRYPQRIATFVDQDGNVLYVSSRFLFQTSM
jgi:DNA-binding GntR family transcriptional regulator